MSAKNQLQEFFQRNKLSLPEYTYIRSGGEDHCPEWICEIQCRIGDETEIFISDVCLSKKEASTEAATKALEAVEKAEERILEFEESQKMTLSVDPTHTLILLDLENVPHSYKNLCKRVKIVDPSKVSIVGFYAHTSTHIRSKVVGESERHSHILHLLEATSSSSDAADVGMCIWIGEVIGMIESTIRLSKQDTHYNAAMWMSIGKEKLDIKFGIARLPKIRVIVITKDHFGKALVELINTREKDIVMWSAELCKSVEDMIE